MIDSRLNTLLTLVKVKNYTKTAQRLFITQPAVTHHIKSLEKEYDIKIFLEKDFELTNEGMILVEYARRMLDQSTQLSSALEKSKTSTKPLKMAMTNASSIIIGKKNMMNVFYQYFNHNFDVRIDSLSDIMKNLQDGIIDLAIIDSDYDDDIFDGTCIDNIPIIPVCYKDGKFKEIKRVTREMLKNNYLALGGKIDGMGIATIQGLKNANIRLPKSNVVTSNSLFLLAESIEALDAIGFIYQDYLQVQPNLKKMDILNFNASQNIYLIYNSNSFDKGTFRSLINNIKKWKA